MTLEAGRFDAVPVECGLKKTKNGDPQVVVQFKIEENTITWFGTLKEGKGREITLKTLVTLGFTGDSVEDLVNGVQVLSQSPVSLVLDVNEWNGQSRLQVKWVNKLGSSALDEKLDRAGAVAIMSGLNLKGDFARLRKEFKTPLPTSDDLPF